MEWIQVLEVFGLIGGIATVLAFFLAPMLWLGSKIDGVRDSLKNDIDSLRQEMAKEMKDFHGRLCAIEERNKGK